jgi:hypothetical protein
MDEVSVLRKLLLAIIFTVFLISAANAQLIAIHELPSDFAYGADSQGKIIVSPTGESKFDISLMLPVTWEITDWSVTGNISAVTFEKTTVSYKDKVNEAFHWLFNGPTTSDVVLTYSTKPMSTGNHNITTLWFYSGGFGSKDDSIFVSGERQTSMLSCGNKICEGAYGESLFSCPRDCAFKYLENMYVWLTILIISLLIIFFGLGYKAYKRYSERKAESFVPEAEPVKIEHRPTKEMLIPLPPPPEEYEAKAPVKKHIVHKAVKMKPVKHKAKKVKVVKKKARKIVKHKAAAKKKAVKKGVKHSDFYSKTMKRLESIKKDLK